MRPILPILLLGIEISLACSGCADLGYYRQAVAGQWELLQARQPVAELLNDPTIPTDLRQQLATAQTLRAFASRELDLPDNGSYRSYVDLHRPFVVKNVFAAPELRLKPHQWCFWFIGCLSYRGYFDADAAQQLAEQLRASGDDVYVADIPAYSTLGWFDDPLLNTFIQWPRARVAELMFHELAHQKLFIADDSAFNEAYATAVGRLGTERWLARYGTAREQEGYQDDYRRRQDFLQLLTATRTQLAAVYDSTDDDDTKRAAKKRIFAELRDRYRRMKQDWGGYAGYDRWFEQDLNNAKLAGHSTYYRLVPAFLALYEREGQDFAAFHRAAAALGQRPAAEREAQLQALSASDPVQSWIAGFRPLMPSNSP